MINNNSTVSLDDDDFETKKKFFTESRMRYNEDQWPASVLACMNEMRKQHQYHDIVLLVDNHEIPAHRAVLACMSPFFVDKIEREAKSHSSVVKATIDGVSPATVEVLVNFAYTGKVEVSSDLVSEVYHAAKEWKVARLKKACATHLLDHMNSKNCLEIRSIANVEADSELLSIVDQFIKTNIDDITNTHDFNQLPLMKLEVISTKKSILMSDRQIFEASVDWIRKMMKGGVELGELIREPQTLLLTANNILKNITEVDELATELVETYDIDMSKVGVYTPDKKKSQNGHQNGNGHCAVGNGSTTPRKLIMSPADVPKPPHVSDNWKVIAATSMDDDRYLALTVLDNQLATVVLYEKRSKPKQKHHPSRSFSIEKDTLHPPLASMHHPRCAIGIAAWDGKLIVAGGYDRGTFHNSIETYDPVTNKWRLQTPMHTPRGRFQLSLVGGAMLAAGGSNGHCELKTCELYNTLTNRWSRAPDMPTQRTCFGATMLNNKMYVVGGASGSSGMTSCIRYDPETSTWTPIASLLEGRSQVSVCTYQGKILAVGGFLAWNCYNSVEVYEPERDQWTAFAPMKTCRRGAGTCVLDGKVYAIGGSDGQTVLDTVECYDPDTDEWTPVATMATPRVNVGVAVVGGKIYAVGGFSGKEFLNSLEVYDPMANRWYQCAMHLSQMLTSSPPHSPLPSNGMEESEPLIEGTEEAPLSEAAAEV